MLSGLASRTIVWLRYSVFILIYPIGIGCEIWLLVHAIQECDELWFDIVMWFELALYVPGTYCIVCRIL
jgi:very-long-chain (3R)-3-hydroxyacyl-CoA dehydratase